MVVECSNYSKYTLYLDCEYPLSLSLSYFMYLMSVFCFSLLQVRDLVTVIIPMREISLVENIDQAASGVLPRALLVTTRGKVNIETRLLKPLKMLFHFTDLVFPEAAI